MKTSAPAFLLSKEENVIYITHTKKPLMVCRLITLQGQPKGVEVIACSDELPEEKRMEGLKKRMMDWYIFKHHNKNKK